LAEAEDSDFLRSVAEAVVQLLMETDVEGLVGAGRHERTAERATYRNGYRDRTLDTRLGSLQLHIPKLRGKAARIARQNGAEKHRNQSGAAAVWRTSFVRHTQNSE
jgi:transposase-like protein